MERSIELDEDRAQLVLRFDYDKFLVDEVRELPGRRWDKGSRCWRVPAKHAEVVVTTMMRHNFDVSQPVMELIAGTRELAEPKEEATSKKTSSPQATDDDPDAPLTVSGLNERVRDALQERFPGRLLIQGELLGYDRSAQRKHVFFQLIEKAEGQDRPLAAVDVAMFERTAQRVLKKLEENGLELKDGVEILVEAKIDLYPATGRYQLILEDIRPEFTLGKLAQSREQVLKELRAQGLDALNRDKELPKPSLRVGVLTSPESDGFVDFLTELEKSGLPFDLGLYPVRVQGEYLKPTVLDGLRWFSRHQDDYDVLCILRGGGSRTDLAGFDDKDIAIQVAEHPLKVLVGIGHERDQSVLDEITTSMKTPTALAAFLVDQALELEAEQREATRRLVNAVRDQLTEARRTLHRRAAQLEREVGRNLILARRQIDSAPSRLRQASRGALRDERQSIAHQETRLVSAVSRRSERARVDLERRAERLLETASRRIEREQTRLDRFEDRRRLLDPERVLRRGYAVVRDEQTGRVLPSIDRFQSDQRAVLQLRDGRAVVHVERTEQHPEDDRNETSADGSP
ncbi:MAG: exodeoxyribonuclease VII large subunit [Planctomycetota bacterium]